MADRRATMRILVAPQEFKGTLTAIEAAEAIAAGLRGIDPAWSLDLLPMADGGPGTLDAVLAASGGERRRQTALNPLMRPVEAEWGLLDGGVAIIECASASGLWRLTPDELDPRRASSHGTGQLVAAALEAGCRTVQVGLGGSATNDGGAGMAQALGYRLLDETGADLPPGGAALARLSRIDASGAHPGIRDARFHAATDVSNPLCGPDGASYVYGPQKGAGPAVVEELDAALAHFAAVVLRDLGVDVRNVPGAGAAGGLGAGLIAFLGADLRPGAGLVGEVTGLAGRIAAADAVITGEGRLDRQTSFGKGPAYAGSLAREAGRPCVCIVGSHDPGFDAIAVPFDLIEVSGVPGAPLPSKDEAAAQLTAAARRAALRLIEVVRG